MPFESSPEREIDKMSNLNAEQLAIAFYLLRAYGCLIVTAILLTIGFKFRKELYLKWDKIAQEGHDEFAIIVIVIVFAAVNTLNIVSFFIVIDIWNYIALFDHQAWIEHLELAK